MTLLVKLAFEPLAPFPYNGFHADVAQPVEQLFRKQQVAGSNPVVGFVFWTLAVLLHPHFTRLVANGCR